MEQNRNDKKFSSQPGKKTEMPSKTSTATTRPEIDLPLKGGRNESDLASKNPSVKSDKAGFDKKSVR